MEKPHSQIDRSSTFGLIIVASLIAASPVPAKAATYTFVDLWQLGMIEATDLNDAGQAVGYCSPVPDFDWNEAFPCLWDPVDGIKDLGDLEWCASRGGCTYSGRVGLNDLGQVVGTAESQNGSYPRASRGFLFSDGGLKELPTLGGDRASATEINDRGQIVGQSTTESGKTHAFLLENDQLTDLGTLAGGYSGAADVNELGQVVGESDGHAFLYESGTLIDLGSTGYRLGINDKGKVVGISLSRPWDEFPFFRYYPSVWDSRNGFKLLDWPACWSDHGAQASAINNRDEVVGEISDLDGDFCGAIFHYVNDLPEQLPYGPVAFGYPVAINRHGQILTTVPDGYSIPRPGLFTPVKTPADLLIGLLHGVTDVGPGTSLVDKVALAQVYYAVPDVPATCAVLADFLRQVEAQSGKKIATPLALEFVEDSREIMSAIGCQ